MTSRRGQIVFFSRNFVFQRVKNLVIQSWCRQQIKLTFTRHMYVWLHFLFSVKQKIAFTETGTASHFTVLYEIGRSLFWSRSLKSFFVTFIRNFVWKPLQFIIYGYLIFLTGSERFSGIWLLSNTDGNGSTVLACGVKNSANCEQYFVSHRSGQ